MYKKKRRKTDDNEEEKKKKKTNHVSSRIYRIKKKETSITYKKQTDE